MLRLEDLEVYQLSMELGKEVWNIVAKWNYFEKDTVGKQLVRSADSIAANIAEGYGRFFYKENKLFCYYGSLLETKSWIVKSRQRDLINEDQYKDLIPKLELVHKKLNGYLKSIGKNGMSNDSDK